GRRLWLTTDGGGRFVYLGGGRWLGQDARSRAALFEARRTPTSIELHGPRQHLDILILDNEVYYRPPYQFQWQPLAQGGCQYPRPMPARVGSFRFAVDLRSTAKRTRQWLANLFPAADNLPAYAPEILPTESAHAVPHHARRLAGGGPVRAGRRPGSPRCGA